MLARWIVAATVLLATFAAFAARGTGDDLSQGGWTPAGAEFMRADAVLAHRFQAGEPQLVLMAETAGSVDAPAAAAAGRALTAALRNDTGATVWVRSYWTTGAQAMRSQDGHSALVLVRFRGSERAVRQASAAAVAHHTGAIGPLTVSASGRAPVMSETERLGTEGLARAELIAAPLVLLVLLWVFGSALAALLPLVVGALAVLTTTAFLHFLAHHITVSVFALSISTALGFGLAVDYSLLMVSRYREEYTPGTPPDQAVRQTLRTSGKAVAYSAATIATSLCALLVFPLPLLRSIAYGGVAVVATAAAGSLVVLPALLHLLGRHIGRYDLFARLRRPPVSCADGAWYRLAHLVMRRPIAVTLAVFALMAALAWPVGQVRLGMYDDRILPSGSPVAQASDRVRKQFSTQALDDIAVLLPDLSPAARATVLPSYAARLSALPQVLTVSTVSGTYRGGRRVAEPGRESARYADRTGAWLSIHTHGAVAYSPEGSRLAHRIRALPPPPAMSEAPLVAGPGARLADTRSLLMDRMTTAIAVTAMATLLLLFAFTRSLLIPVKALALNVLSLAATAGILVGVFQEGYGTGVLGDFRAVGVTDIIVPGLMFCIAFGLSMDYEVFLLSRIVEEHRSGHGTEAAVARGLQHTGRLFTTAALVFAIVMASLAASDLVLLQIVGVGLAVAVVLDATLVRALLVPAIMRLAGRANWWAPPVRFARADRPGSAVPDASGG
ncbi:MMPL family transporter [Streptomyces lavendulae]|uniref:MMPL family transporter n=1 Tax=Streptomyces lavendulae TaxID=1914 RepID=UPI00340A0E57